MTVTRPLRLALVLRKTLGKPSRIGAGPIGNARISRFVKYALTRTIIVLIGFGTVWISAPPAAMADPSGGDTKQESTGSQNAPDGSDSTNNGSDLTRPQNSFETRLRDQTSASPTSRTNRDSLFLQLNSKVTFDDGWKLAMLARVPVVTESTVTFDPSGSDQVFGLGNAVFQTILAHAIDERWALASAQGLSRGQRATIWATGNGKSCRVWRALSNPRMGAGQLFRPGNALGNELCRRSVGAKN